jgi:hypothetical protein
LWPKDWPKPSAGTVSGTVTFAGEPNARATGQLNIANFGFGDASGLHAGEKIAAALSRPILKCVVRPPCTS